MPRWHSVSLATGLVSHWHSVSLAAGIVSHWHSVSLAAGIVSRWYSVSLAAGIVSHWQRGCLVVGTWCAHFATWFLVGFLRGHVPRALLVRFAPSQLGGLRWSLSAVPPCHAFLPCLSGEPFCRAPLLCLSALPLCRMSAAQGGGCVKCMGAKDAGAGAGSCKFVAS